MICSTKIAVVKAKRFREGGNSSTRREEFSTDFFTSSYIFEIAKSSSHVVRAFRTCDKDQEVRGRNSYRMFGHRRGSANVHSVNTQISVKAAYVCTFPTGAISEYFVSRPCKPKCAVRTEAATRLYNFVSRHSHNNATPAPGGTYISHRHTNPSTTTEKVTLGEVGDG